MKANFFGHYLVEKALIDDAQLQRAVSLQHQTNQRLGEIAVAQGLLSQQQADHVARLQKANDKRFGEIAAEEKLLTDSQIQTLLGVQHQQRKFLGEILVQEGMLSQEQLVRELAAHQIAHHAAFQQLEQSINDHVAGNLLSLAITHSNKIWLRLLKSCCHYQCMVTDYPTYAATMENTFYIAVKGDIAFTVGLAMNNKAMLNVTSTFVDMNEEDCDVEFSRDAVSELLNIILGQILGELAQDNMHYESSMPDASQSNLFIAAKSSLAVEMTSELGSFILWVSQPGSTESAESTESTESTESI